MTDMYHCPVEGCDYTGVKQSVAAHYSGKKPESGHEGGYERAQSLLDDQDTMSDQDSQPESKPAEQADEQSDNQNGDNPLKEGPDARDDAVGSSHESTEPSCPECDTPAGMGADELEDGARYKCESCGTILIWNDDE